MFRTLLFSAAAAVVVTGVIAGPAGAEPPSPVPPSPVPPGPVPPDAGASVPPAGPPADALVLVESDGSYAVGTEILPGVYTSAGPVAGDVCYWRRADAEGTTLANAMTKQPQVVQIEPTDAVFTTNGCQPWQLTNGAVPPGQTPSWLAQLQLRHHLDVLNGLAGQSGNGQLPPY